MTQILDEAARAAALKALPDWRILPDRDAMATSFVFADFAAAFGFMTRIAEAAEEADHHPEWFNVYKRVDVVLATHDAGGITQKDVALAHVMEEAARGIVQSRDSG